MSKASVLRNVGSALVAAALASGAHSATIVKDNTVTSVIPGLTGFATTGAMMTGLSVTATFLGGFTQTLNWATTGAASGGVTGTGWSLSLTGDSFAALWAFTIAPTAGLQLTSLMLDGTNALTVFDTSTPAGGTPGSANGADLTMTDAALNAAATATYTKVVAVSPNAFIGDLYQTLFIDFGQSGPRGDFTFRQDTDNDSRFGRQIPEPGALALVGLALLGAGALKRRRKG